MPSAPATSGRRMKMAEIKNALNYATNSLARAGEVLDKADTREPDREIALAQAAALLAIAQQLNNIHHQMSLRSP
jgi:hypothetical protein